MSIASLARDVQSDPAATIREAALAGWVLNEVSRVHTDLNRIGDLLKLAIREGVSDRASYNRLNLELIDSIIQIHRAVNRLAGQW